jgi:hypothetical protein
VGVGGVVVWCGCVLFSLLLFSVCSAQLLGAVCGCLCFVIALCVLLLLVMACAGESHFFGCFLHWLSVGLQIGWLMAIILRLY